VKGKREREEERLRREARTTFGITAKIAETPPPDFGLSPGQMIDEQRRLEARHDPQQASACRICGLTVAAGGQEAANWKICPDCALLVPGGLGAVVSVLLGTPVGASEALDVLDGAGLASPAFFWRRWPTERGHQRRWEHVPADFAERGRDALAQVRARRALRRSSGGRGCSWCGQARSTSWTECPLRWGEGRGAPRGAICGECLPWAKRAGVFSGSSQWREHLLAACLDLRKASMGLHFDLRAYFETSPPDPSGSSERWAYLGDVRAKLRARVVRSHPRLVTMTATEARVVRLEAAIAAAAVRAEPRRLADV